MVPRACPGSSEGLAHFPWHSAQLSAQPSSGSQCEVAFAGSYATPCLNTMFTFRTSEMFADGSPSMTTRSACFPAAIDPIADRFVERIRALPV